MTFAQIAAVYGVVWLAVSVHFCIDMYQRGALLNAEEKIRESPDIANDPEMVKHWEENVHGVRSKLRILLAALPIVLGFMFGSVWPLILMLRLFLLIQRVVRK